MKKPAEKITTAVAELPARRTLINEMAARFHMDREPFIATLKKTVLPGDTSNEQLAAPHIEAVGPGCSVNSSALRGRRHKHEGAGRKPRRHRGGDLRHHQSKDMETRGMSRSFEHDSLVCHLTNVNCRKELHGEEDVLAVDVSLRLMMGEAGTEWDPVLKDLLGEIETDLVETLAPILTKLPFSAEYEDHKVNFRVSTELLASLTHAKLNKFVVEFEDIGITFRVQASQVDGETIGALSELIGTKVRLEVVSLQGELALEPPADDPPKAKRKPRQKPAEHLTARA